MVPAQNSAVWQAESRFEKQALTNAAREIGVPKGALARRVRARLAEPGVRSTDSRLRQEETLLEKQAMERAAKEIGVSKHDLARNVRSRLAARRQHMQGGAGASAANVTFSAFDPPPRSTRCGGRHANVTADVLCTCFRQPECPHPFGTTNP